jgi:hypothetical protein
VMPSLRYTTCVPHETALHVRGVMAVTLVPFGATSECARQTLTVDKNSPRQSGRVGPLGEREATPSEAPWRASGTGTSGAHRRRQHPDVNRAHLFCMDGAIMHLENGAVWKYTVKKCKQSRSFLHCTARQHARTACTPANNLRTFTFSQITGKPSSSPS